MSTVAIGLASSSNFVLQSANMAISAASKTSWDLPICYIGESDECCQKFLDVMPDEANVQTKRFSETDHSLIKEHFFQESRHDIGSIHYSQLFFPKYFKEFSHIIYLEGDMIAKRSLSPLIEWCQTADYSFAAAEANKGEDPNSYRFKAEYYADLKKYFNTGLFCFNTSKYHLLNFDEVVNLMKLNVSSGGSVFEFYAQGILNIVCKDHITELDFKYNTSNLGYDSNIPASIIEAATILHWNGSRKPWLEDGLYKHYYEKHVNEHY